MSKSTDRIATYAKPIPTTWRNVRNDSPDTQRAHQASPATSNDVIARLNSPDTNTTNGDVSCREGATLGRGNSRLTSSRLHDLVDTLASQTELGGDLLEAHATVGEPFHDQAVALRVTRATRRKRSPCPRGQARKFSDLLGGQVSATLAVANVGHPRAKFHVTEVGRFDVITRDA